jgi:ABC-type glutathione transport system ATPase component
LTIKAAETRHSSPWIEQNSDEKMAALQRIAIGPELVGWEKEAHAIASFLTSEQTLLDIVGPEGSGKSAIAEGIARTARPRSSDSFSIRAARIPGWREVPGTR